MRCFLCRLLLLEKGSEDVDTLSQIFTETCAALTYPLGKSFTFAMYSTFKNLLNVHQRDLFLHQRDLFLYFFPTENKSYSSVRTEALSLVDLIVKRTGG